LGILLALQHLFNRTEERGDESVFLTSHLLDPLSLKKCHNIIRTGSLVWQAERRAAALDPRT
jgi:hypothetical protein